ncbi:MAG TPA: hypothetical protein VGQ41_09975 [Pyrinomonadaceae bacterium]|nr:hypothetical protein [Pyrinomonadaceae bacterium]
MTKHLLTSRRVLLFALATILFASSSALGAVTITVVDGGDAAGVGFKDNTPVSPVGGNNGTTLGQQRLNALQHAADIWGAILTSGPSITITATWPNDLPCTDTTAALASAGTTTLHGNFPNAIFPNTWYGAALANKLSGSDRNGGTAEIDAVFNLRIGTAGCLSSKPWYYGLDNNHGTGVDLVTVALHEFAHGLGFASFTNEETGAQPSNRPSVYDRFLRDNTTGKTWPEMTDAERVASAINFRNLAWIGAQVTASVPSVLTSGTDGSSHALMYTPNPVDPGSTVSHFDRGLSPNQLMEPNISSNLTHSVMAPQDLTFALLSDVGWVAGPPASPTPTPTPPANDNFVSAQVLTGCSGSVTGTNISATKESGEPNHLSSQPDNHGGTHSAWYQWQAPISESVIINTSGSNFDTVLGVYTGTQVNDLTVVAQNDDVDPGVVQSSTVTFNAVAGTIYKIAVDGYDSGDGGDTGAIQLNWGQQFCPGNVPGLAPQILLEESGPVADQAAIFESIFHVRDPFPLVNSGNLLLPVGDQNTRVVIFTLNLPESFESGLKVNLIDSSNKSFEITPIDVHQFTEFSFSQVTFRLPNGLSSGTCKVRVFSRSLVSNTATFRML